MGFTDMFKELIFENEVASVPSDPPAGVPVAPTMPVASGVLPLAKADPEKVQKLVVKVCAGSAILGQFMTGFDRAARYFPNDELGRVRSALASMDVDKTAFSAEMTRVIEQGITGLRGEIEGARKSAYDAQVGVLERSLETARAEIAQLESTLAASRQSIEPMEAQIKNARDELARRDAVSNASLAAAERFLGRIKQHVEQL